MGPKHLCLSSYSGEFYHFKITELSYPPGTNGLGDRENDNQPLLKIPG